eukprot:TRINITY_DN16476_c0_g1_i2.p1 TRINITY_DN16476_c0_g1~~TRINITY_DN16476_c0_g1_i2.p1  ORF type:complete len:257 (+),score=45.64 TRINITY_DN16476_c0_g1_i2:85-855(+)
MAAWYLLLLLASACYRALSHVPDAMVRRVIRALCGDGVKVKHFDHTSILHSLLMGSCALGCHLWELAYADVRYPVRIYSCLGPASTLAWVLPPVEAGFALNEVADVLLKKWDRLLLVHGVMVLSTLVFFQRLGFEHHVSFIFMIHLSTVPLNMRGLDFSPFVNLLVDATFAALFVALRNLLLVGLWLQFLFYGYQIGREQWGSCMNASIVVVVVLVGLLIHGLNLFWAAKIFRKVWAKFNGESVRTGSMEDTGYAE